MDRLLTMTTFTKVVKLSSFTAAANDIGVSRALVSRHIIDLESYFGVRLLNRTTRSVTPTEAGKHYYEFCTRILSEIRTEDEVITTIKTGIEGKISVVAPKWIGSLDISEALSEFCLLNPKISIQLSLGGVSSKTHDFLERGFDICFHTKNIRDSLVKAKKIAEIEYVLVAAPKYLAERGEPLEPKQLLQHDCLTQPAEPLWHLHGEAEQAPLKVPSRFCSNSYAVLCTAAVAGLGIAILPRRVAAAHLSNGALTSVLQQFPIENRRLYAAYSPGENIPRKVRSLLTFLGDWFRARSLSPDEPDRGVSLDSLLRARAAA